jgi:excisionase family DNA binding protein
LTISIRTAAALLGVDERTVRKAIRLRQIHAFPCGEQTLIPTLPLRRALGLLDDEDDWELTRPSDEDIAVLNERF